MKKLLLFTILMLSTSCGGSEFSKKVPNEYTLDECINQSNITLSKTEYADRSLQSALNSKQILINQIVIMRELKKLKK